VVPRGLFAQELRLGRFGEAGLRFLLRWVVPLVILAVLASAVVG
jgi:hypothetical protein